MHDREDPDLPVARVVEARGSIVTIDHKSDLRVVKSHGKFFFVERSAIPTGEQKVRMLEAEAMLAKMRVRCFEDLASMSERSTCEAIRRSSAARYRAVFAIDPEKRDALRRRLEEIRAGGELDIEEAVRLAQRSGPSSGDETADSSAP